MDYLKTQFIVLQNKTCQCINSHFNKHTWRSISLFSDPSSWYRLDGILRTSSKGSPSYWLWRNGWLHSRTLGWA